MTKFIVELTLLATFALAASDASVSGMVSCTPIVLDGDYSVQVSCRLTKAPVFTPVSKNRSVVLFFEAYGLKISICNLLFNSDNWSVPQSFKVTAIPDVFANSTSSQLSIKTLSVSEDESYSNKVQILSVIKTAKLNRKPISCTIIGDPHIFAFDSDVSVLALTKKKAIHFDFYSTGVYYLVESSAGLRILGSYFDCAQGLTCLGGISVQFNAVTYVISVETKSQRESLKVSSIGKTTSGTDYSIDTASKIMTIHLEDGSVIHITYGAANGVIAFEILLAPIHYGKVGGHCHYWDDSNRPEKLYCNKQTWDKWSGDWFNQDNVNAWGKCWIVKDSENVFKGNVGTPQGSKTCDDFVPLFCKIPEIQVPALAKSCPVALPPYSPCDYKNGGCSYSTTIAPQPASSTMIPTSSIIGNYFLQTL